MKKLLSFFLCFVIICSSSAALVSCGEPAFSNELTDGYLYAEVLEAKESMAVSETFVLRVWICNREAIYSKADLKISFSEECFSFEEAGADGEVKAEYEDFAEDEYVGGVYKDYKVKYIGPAISDGCAFGKITVDMHAESSDGSKSRQFTDYVAFASMGDYVAFGNDPMESYLETCKKLPDWKSLRAHSNHPLGYSVVPISVESVSYNYLEVVIESLDCIPVGDPFDIEIGFVAEHKDRKSGALDVVADGFSISDESDNEYDDRYEISYSDLDIGDYGISGGVEKREGYNIYRGTIFNHTEKISLISNKTEADSGDIKITFSTDEETVYVKGYAKLKIYYATDGKYIAYSLESVDEAKRALYSDFEYFFKVTLPEYFTDLSGGCD